MAKEYYTVPTNDEIAEIDGDRHLSQNVKEGILRLHRYDSYIKTFAQKYIRVYEDSCDNDDYIITVVEILAPHLIDMSKEYVNETINAFMNLTEEEKNDLGIRDDFKEAFLIQIISTSHTSRFAELHDDNGNVSTWSTIL